MGTAKPVIQQLNRGVAGSDVEGFSPFPHCCPQVIDHLDRGGSASLFHHSGVARFFCPNAMGVGFLPGGKQRFENGGIEGGGGHGLERELLK